MKGKIVKGIAGFYYVNTEDAGTYECKAKGIFRKKGQKPLVGDLVEIEVIDEAKKVANVIEILPRKNALIRPAVANVDQAMVFFALRSPNPDATLLDRFLIMMARQDVPVFICFNKKDLAEDAEAEHWREIYTSCGYDVMLIAAGKEEGTDEVRQRLTGKTTVIAGPSGAGKSTFTNLMQTEVHMETGDISKKLGRGKNTTRHAELLPIGHETFFCDTPGFTSMDIPDMEPEELQQYFPEFAPYEPGCRFQGCAHIHEPSCGVKDALAEQKIYQERYENYCRFYEELQDMKRRRY
uniref:ribosome small subunit-dependent GTPase A n=1 Tax=Eubacterium cellulosolvens TaxID=29322 RepID=UPI000486DEEF|nr:ribosome small subunit-dependent GTPase A [[Eubacterium] cellulosolvens]